MVKVGVVYKSDGNLDLTSVPLRVKLSVFINHMIDSSYLLSGNRSKMEMLKEEEEKTKIHEYTIAFMYYLKQSSFKTQHVIPMTYNIEDQQFVEMALANPAFFEYKKQFVPMEPNLAELLAYKSGVVIIRRFQT